VIVRAARKKGTSRIIEPNGRKFVNRCQSFSGKGWGIFVCDPTGNLYLGTHKVGRFHHSSFLEGTAVIAAGEMVVENGQILLGSQSTWLPYGIAVPRGVAVGGLAENQAACATGRSSRPTR
jgi:hypothetical protein